MALDTPPKLSQRRNLAFALETTTGTPATLAAAQGVTQVFNSSMKYASETVDRQGQGALSPIQQAVGGRSGTCEFEVEVRGSGATGLPAWTNLLLACGCQINEEVISPLTGQIQTITIGLQIDGRFKTLSGCMGNAVFTFMRGKPTRVKFTFTGVQQPPQDVTQILPTYATAPIAPQVIPTFTFGEVTPRVSQVTFDLGNHVVLREDAAAVDSAGNWTGYRNAYITGRKPTIKMDPEALALATINYYALQVAYTLTAFSLTIGSATNNTIALAAPQVQIVETPEDGDRQGLYVDEVTGLCTRDTPAGDDEYSLTFS